MQILFLFQPFCFHTASTNKMPSELEIQLYIAAGYGWVEEIESLIRKGADINGAFSDYGYSPLNFAVTCNEVQSVKILIKHKVKVENKILHKYHATNYYWDGFKIPKILLHNGADINAKAFNGNTPLHFAVMLDWNPKYAHFLMRNGASLKIRNNDGMTPLECALRNDRQHFVKVIIYNQHNAKM